MAWNDPQSLGWPSGRENRERPSLARGDGAHHVAAAIVARTQRSLAAHPCRGRTRAGNPNAPARSRRVLRKRGATSTVEPAYDAVLGDAQALYAQSRAVHPRVQTVSALSRIEDRIAERSFALPWSHYVRLLAVRDEAARRSYETEARSPGDPGSGWKAEDTVFEARRAALQSEASCLRLRFEEPSRPRWP
jgi:hypothetical protein